MFEISSVLGNWVIRLTGGASTSVYQVSSLEVAVVAGYFAIMVILSLYGLHRYQLVYLFYKHRASRLDAPPARFAALPPVTVQLPIYNEQFVVDQLLEAVCRLDYPKHLLQIQVLDDSTDETKVIARRAAERWASLGYPVEYHHRPHREGFKAGALQAGLACARGEFIAIFDADFQPRPDFLHQTIHYFTGPQVGMVQARWTYLNRDHSLLTRIQAILLDGHFVFEHGARFRSGRFFNFNGTAGILRRAMIDDAGGWQHDTLTEDTDLSYRAQLKGWKYLYLPHVEVPSELPTDLMAFQTQQARWAKGLIQTAKKILPKLLKADLPAKVKAEAWFHLTANISYPLIVALSILLLPAMIVRFYHWDGEFLYLDIPLFLGTFSSLSTFYLLSQKELFPESWSRKLPLLPFLVAVGVGLTITNTRAVLEGLLGIQSPFQRTAKYTSDAGRARLARRKYGLSSGWLPMANFLLGIYFAGCLAYSAVIGNWATIPFLGLFVVGYSFTAGVLFSQSFERRESAGRRRLQLSQASTSPSPVSECAVVGSRESSSNLFARSLTADDR